MRIEMLYNFDKEVVERINVYMFEDNEHKSEIGAILHLEDYPLNNVVIGEFLKYVKAVNNITGNRWVYISERCTIVEICNPNWENFGNSCSIRTKLINSHNYDLSLYEYTDMGEEQYWDDKFGKLCGNDGHHHFLPPYSKGFIEEYGLMELYGCYFKGVK